MIGGLSNAVNSLNTMQKAINTTSNNIANANTVGFARTDVNLKEASIGGVNYSGNLQFSASAQSRLSSLISTDAKSSALVQSQDTLQSNLSLISSNVSTDFSNLKSAFSAVDSDNSSSVSREVANEALKSITSTLNSGLDSLNQTVSALSSSKDAAISGATVQVQALADFNKNSLDFRTSSEGRMLATQLVQSVSESVGGVARFNEDGTVSLTVGNANVVEGSSVVNKLTDVSISGGKIGGINEAISNANSSISDLKAAMSKFSADVNAANATGTTVSGNVGNSLFSVDSEGKLLYNGNSSLIATVSNTGSTFGTRMTDSLNNVSNSVVSLAAKEGSKYSSYASTQSSAQASLDLANKQVQAESGVDLDSEAVKLMAYQRNYEAIAKVIQVQNDMFGTLLDIVA